MEETKNDKTLTVYEENFDKYVAATPGTNGGSQKEWLDYTLSLVSKEDSILEIGAAHGRDAVYIRNLGYSVIPTDAFDQSVKHLQEMGFSSRKLNILKDTISGKFGLILAAAVFVHFDKSEAMLALGTIKEALQPGGLFAFSVKQGSGEAWSEHKMGQPRYFCYWSMVEVREMLESMNFNILDVRELENSKWIHIVCRKGGE